MLSRHFTKLIGVKSILWLTVACTVVTAVMICGVDELLAQQPPPKPLAVCSGELYRSKRKGVPVYLEPITTSTMVRKLALGEKVCYLGERDGFALIDDSVNVSNSGGASEGAVASSPSGGPAVVRYVRLVELWGPKERRRPDREGRWQKFMRIYRFLRSGGVAETGVVPTP